MYIHRSHNCTDIYPFIDSVEQAAAADRITVWDLQMVDDASLRIQYRGLTFTEENYQQLTAAFDEAFRIATDGDAPLSESDRLIEQLCRDLNEAHNEILRQQGVVDSDYGKFDWPEWTPQANSIRWAERILRKRLAKTENWTLYPATTLLSKER